MTQGDGLDEVLGGAVRVAATVAGQVVEQRARDRERQAREARERILAETRRLGGRERATAAVVVAADVARGWDSPERRADLEDTLTAKVPDPEAVQARLLTDRGHAKPPTDATRSASRAQKARKAPSKPGRVRDLGR